MNYSENSTNNLNKPNFYLRYVDDILAAFDNEQDSLNSLHFLNKKRINSKIYDRKTINHSIAFIDVFTPGINNQNLTLFTHFTIQPIQALS